MNIGIITLPLHTNYGGIMQAYALQYVLKKMNHNVVIIDYKGNRFSKWIMPLVYLRRFFLRYIKRNKNVIVFSEKKREQDFPIFAQHTEQFIKENIDRKTIKSFYSINKNEFDVLIVGSDQIWRPKYFQHIENAYLHFARRWDIKRISYAASFGTDSHEYSSRQIRKCKKLIHLFDRISVREESGIGLCNEYFNKSVVQVLDPTLLLCTSDYKKIIQKSSSEEREGILTYILDTSSKKQEIIDITSKILSMEVFTTINPKIRSLFAKNEDRIAPPVEDWLKGFMDCDFVITDSFHCCIFSVLFQKPFIVIGNEERGLGRIVSILSIFNLQDRLITSADDLPSVIRSTIDWDKINSILEEKRAESLHFLLEALR